MGILDNPRTHFSDSEGIPIIMQERIDAVYGWVWCHTRTLFTVFILVFALIGAVTTYAMVKPPNEVVSIEEAFIVESSRDVNETPQAVAQRGDGSRVFVGGVYTEGQPVALGIDAEGEVVQGSQLEYWLLLFLMAVLSGAVGAIPAIMIYFHVDDSERVRRQQRRASDCTCGLWDKENV